MRPLVKTGCKRENQASLAKCTDTGTCARRMHAAQTADPEVGGTCHATPRTHVTGIHQERSETNPPLWDENKHPRGPPGTQRDEHIVLYGRGWGCECGSWACGSIQMQRPVMPKWYSLTTSLCLRRLLWYTASVRMDVALPA